MRLWKSLALAATMLMMASAAQAVTLRYAFQGDLNALDPYTLNETFTLGALGNVMEGLTARDKELKIVPALAERWEIVEPTRWRFHLRRGVKFMAEKNLAPTMFCFHSIACVVMARRSRAARPADMKAVKIDDHTVDFVLSKPNPILNAEWDTWYMFSKKWSETVGATQAQSAKASAVEAWALQANGTGPFTVVKHEPGVKTQFKKNPNWWRTAEHKSR